MNGPPLDGDYVQITRRSYAESLQHYRDQTSSYEPFPGLEAEVRAFADAAPEGRLLDLGAGAGRDSRLLRELGHVVVSTDICGGFLAPDDGPAVQMDARNLPFSAHSFSGIWCCAVLLHLAPADAAQAMCEIARVAMPGGLVEVSVKAGGASGGFATKRDLGPRWFSYWKDVELESLVTEAGLTFVTTRSRQSGTTEWITVVAQGVRTQ